MNEYREEYEAAKKRVSIAEDAIDALQVVRSKMLDLVLDGALTSAEFDNINALETQLTDLYKRLNTADIFGPSYRDFDMKYLSE